MCKGEQFKLLKCFNFFSKHLILEGFWFVQPKMTTSFESFFLKRISFLQTEVFLKMWIHWYFKNWFAQSLVPRTSVFFSLICIISLFKGQIDGIEIAVSLDFKFFPTVALMVQKRSGEMKNSMRRNECFFHGLSCLANRTYKGCKIETICY